MGTLTLRIPELRFGSVKEVDGASISVKAESLEQKYASNDYFVEVGAYVNCGGLHGNTICIVSKVQVEEVDKKIIQDDGSFIYEPYDLKRVTLAIVGSIDNKNIFSRGISRLPFIGSDTYFLTSDQVNMILGVNENENSRCFLVTDDEKEKAYLDIDKLLGRHTAILGTTGSGKSCTVASIIQSILRDYPFPRILFFDLHNEYPSAFGHGDTKSEEFYNKTQCIKWDDFSLPYWFLDLDEFIAIYYPDAGGTQAATIKNAIVKLKQSSSQIGNIPQDRISADTPVFFDIKELVSLIKEEEGKQTSPSKKEPFIKILKRLENVIEDPRYSFLQKDKDGELDLSDYFINLLGLSEKNQKHLSILDLSGLPSDVRNVCIGIMSRLCFDYRYWDLDPQDLPMTLVLEEAHTYIPEEASSRFSLCKERIERIAKEGRKYGLSLIVVTQRPANVSTTVLSQCGTFITLRLTNDNDQNKVRRLLPDTLAGQADVLPSLRDGEALVSGDGIKLPRKVRFRSPKPFPKSNDIEYSKAWKDGVDDKYSTDKAIRGWKLRAKQK